MNVRRGLFRLWLVASVLFIALVGILSFRTVRAEFTAAERWRLAPVVYLPVLCADARGLPGEAYSLQESEPGPWDKFSEPNASATCWYGRAEFRKSFPEYADLTDAQLDTKLYARIGRTDPHREPTPWAFVVGIAAGAFGVPLLVLALGASLVWAFSGFARSVS